MRHFLPILTVLLTLASPSQAEEKKPEEIAPTTPAENAGRFAPDFCDFEITFPEAPAAAQKCVPGAQCYDVQSYTMVYDLRTTVDISITCTPLTPEAAKQYSEPVMKAALAGMIDNRRLSTHDIRFEKMENGTKSAAITGVGKTGRQDKIYSAQIWVGPNSIFTVQAELIGGAHDVADKSFRDILQSLKHKGGKQIPRPAKAIIPKLGNQ
ncbi:MAG: hypothetical protein WC989_03245 [Micavibrio sp.]